MKVTRHVLGALAFCLSAGVFAGPININTASADEIQAELSGVGPVIANRIVEYRKEHGAFDDPTAVVRVKGFGARTLARNRQNLLVE